MRKDADSWMGVRQVGIVEELSTAKPGRHHSLLSSWHRFHFQCSQPTWCNMVELRCRTGRRFAPTKLARFAPEIFAEHLHPDNTTGKQDGASEETLFLPQSPQPMAVYFSRVPWGPSATILQLVNADHTFPTNHGGAIDPTPGLSQAGRPGLRGPACRRR